MSRTSDAYLDRYGTHGQEPSPPPRESKGIHVLLQQVPQDPDGQVSWAMEIMAYAWLTGNKALENGGVYRPASGGGPGVLMRFLKRVEASMEIEQERSAAE